MKCVLHFCVEESNRATDFGGGVGGYTTYTNRLIAAQDSFLKSGFEMHFSRVTPPLKLKPKLLVDLFKLLFDAGRALYSMFRYRPDVIHIHGMYWRSTYREVIFLVLGRIFSANVFYEARGGSFSECIQHRSLQGHLARFLLRSAQVVSIQGEKEIGSLAGIAGRSILYMPNVISPQLERMRFENKKFSERDVDFCFLGYVSRAKNIELFFNIAELNPDKKFTCIGFVERGLLDAVSLPKNVSLLGRLDKVDAFRVLQNTKFFLFPSKMRSEGQPNAILEAIWAGCVPIAFNHGFIADLIQDETLMLDPNVEDLTALNNQVMKLYRMKDKTNRSHRSELISFTRSHAEVERLIEVYRHLVK